MKKFLVLIVLAALAPAVAAKVWTTVYRCDETTPLAPVDPNHPHVYRDIMVGTRLVIVISSDTGGAWAGALMISWEDWPYGTLSGRGYNEQTRNYDGSCLEAAGSAHTALAKYREISEGARFELAARASSVPGDWFVFDYHAQRSGRCDAKLYNYFVDPRMPSETLSFTHVPSRDFDDNDIVDSRDFALLAAQWHAPVDPNSPNAAFDLNGDAHIDAADLALFSEYWLERTEYKPTDPNNPSPSL